MPTVFLITPFAPESAGDEDPATFEAVQAAIENAARSVGVELLRADNIFEPGVVIDQIREAIESAEVVVAVCTGRNPNVFYELGMAHVIGHRPILIAAAATDLPFDVGHLRAQLYSHDLNTLEDRLVQSMRAALDAAVVAKAPVAVLDPEFLQHVSEQIQDFLSE